MLRTCRNWAVAGLVLVGVPAATDVAAQTSAPLSPSYSALPPGGGAAPAESGASAIPYPVPVNFPQGAQALSNGPSAQAVFPSGNGAYTPGKSYPQYPGPGGPELAPGAANLPGAGAAAPSGAGMAPPTAPEAGMFGDGTSPVAPPAAFEPGIAGFSPEQGVGAQAAFTPNMIGDLSPFYSQPVHRILPHASGLPPFPPGIHGLTRPFPAVRNFKISENQSPMPQDRIFWDFNFYGNLNAAVNRAQGVPVTNMNAYTYLWGFEKTFDQGNGSFGMRLPLQTLTASSPGNAIATPTSTALSNLDIYIKYILKKDLATGSVLTAGFQISPQTAGSRFAGAPYMFALNTTYMQPFIAYIWRRDRFFVQGFHGFDFPSNIADVTLMYNDVALGYFLYNNPEGGRLITGVAPTFEVHVNSPLNHRNPFNQFDLAATANNTNLTYGLTALFGRRATLTAALVTPVSTPKPFDAEFALLLNVFYGRTARGLAPITPPVVQ